MKATAQYSSVFIVSSKVVLTFESMSGKVLSSRAI